MILDVLDAGPAGDEPMVWRHGYQSWSPSGWARLGVDTDPSASKAPTLVRPDPGGLDAVLGGALAPATLHPVTRHGSLEAWAASQAGLVDGLRIGPEVAPHWEPKPQPWEGESCCPLRRRAWRHGLGV